MKCKLYFLFVFLSLFLVNNIHSQDNFKQIFGSKYSRAKNEISAFQTYEGFFAQSDFPVKFCWAIVFPELIRFSYLQNELETLSLEILYVQYGENYSDFSIGKFQIKPSFAEKIEKDYNRLFTHNEKVKAGISAFALNNNPQQRKNRIYRLKSDEWQVKYLFLFLCIVQKYFPASGFKSNIEKLRFYATAYNCGYWKGEKLIRNEIKSKRFHTEIFTGKCYYNYSDISVFYYSDH